MTDPFVVWEHWLEWLDSHDGGLWRRTWDGTETDSDLIGTIPSLPGKAILTVGDLRALVAAGREWRLLKEARKEC